MVPSCARSYITWLLFCMLRLTQSFGMPLHCAAVLHSGCKWRCIPVLDPLSPSLASLGSLGLFGVKPLGKSLCSNFRGQGWLIATVATTPSPPLSCFPYNRSPCRLHSNVWFVGRPSAHYFIAIFDHFMHVYNSSWFPPITLWHASLFPWEPLLLPT